MYIALILPIIVIVSVAAFLYKIQKDDKIIKPLRNQRILFAFIIIWTVFGFFTQQDFTEQCGCLVHSRNIFSIDYLIFSALSLILLIVAFLIRNKFIRIVFVCLELAYWIFKLFALKSGYEGGLGILTFKYYDFVGLLARILLLNSLSGYKFKEHVFALVAGLVIIIKMIGYPCKENFIYKNYLYPFYNSLIFDQINGNWTGSMLYPKDSIIEDIIKNPDNIIYGSNPEINLHRDTIIYLRIENVFFSFKDSILTIEKTNPELNGQYFLTYSYPESRSFVYLPCQYLDEAKRDYHFNQYSITIFFEDISDSTFSCYINNRIKLTLKNCR